jgi:hypothetical protein
VSGADHVVDEVADHFVQSLFDRSREIAARYEQTETLLLGGHRIRLQFAGPPLQHHIGPALAHLPRVGNDEPAELTITLWDAATTGEAYPDLNLPEVGANVTGTLRAPGLLMTYRSSPRSMIVLDRRTNQAVFIAESVEGLPPWERPAPMRSLLGWWLVDQGKLVAHAAAVATEEGAALLIGRGGSGKSSTSLVCMAAGMGWLGDDYVILDPARRTVSSLFGSAKLTSDHHDRHPELLRPQGSIHHAGLAEKRFGFPATDLPERVCLESDVRAVVLPVVTNGPECRLHKTTTAKALLALAPTTIFLGGALSTEVFALAREAVAPYEPYRLELGAGVEEVPQMLSQLIAEGRPR